MTPEEKARIARENGAKSKGPITEEGKAKASANAIKTGEHITAEHLAKFMPPHQAVICNEDRAKYFKLVKQLFVMYQPANQLAAGLVHDIAVNKWQILRLQACATVQWNLALIENGKVPAALPPEFGEMEAMGRSSESLIGRSALIKKINHEIGYLHKSVIVLERQIEYIHKTFPTVAPPDEAPEEPKEKRTNADVEKERLSAKPIYVTENSPAVIAAYRKQYPNRPIVIRPADYVAKGINLEDDMPVAPRKAA